MKYTKLGNSDLSVSRICMGCKGFGDPGRGKVIGVKKSGQLFRSFDGMLDDSIGQCQYGTDDRSGRNVTHIVRT